MKRRRHVSHPAERRRRLAENGARDALIAEAARRAQKTHRVRREHEPEEEKARIEAGLERASEAAVAREERNSELEAERREQDRRGVDPDAERMALAKDRHRTAAMARDERLEVVAADRSAAATSAAIQAARTNREHAEEQIAFNDARSDEYRALVEARVIIAARLREYRAQRVVEQAEVEKERRTASVVMARQARGVHRLRLLEDEEMVLARAFDARAAGALSALIEELGEAGAEKSVRRSLPAGAALIGEGRKSVEAARGKRVLSKDSGEDSRYGRGVLRKILRGLRRAA